MFEATPNAAVGLRLMLRPRRSIYEHDICIGTINISAHVWLKIMANVFSMEKLAGKTRFVEGKYLPPTLAFGFFGGAKHMAVRTEKLMLPYDYGRRKWKSTRAATNVECC